MTEEYLGETTLLAVYGSLRAGFGNHVFLEDSKLISMETVDGYIMYSLGAFPCVTLGEGSVIVEVYEVDEYTLSMCDMLEGVPHHYERWTVETRSGMEIEMYVYSREPFNSPLVESGDWSKRSGEPQWWSHL